MRLQHRYATNPTTTNPNTSNNIASTNSANSASNHNNINIKRAKKLSGSSNNSSGIIKLRSANQKSSKMPPQMPMDKQAEVLVANGPLKKEELSEEVEEVEETTTSVELRSSASSHFRAYTTIRSNSTSAILAQAGLPPLTHAGMLYARPRTLNVHNVCQTPAQITQLFFGYVFPFDFLLILICFGCGYY